MSAAQRNRGKRAEVAVVNYLRAQGWPDARRYLSGDGRQPGDIDFHPLICLEVKDRAQSSWPSWCRQAAAEARTGLVPAVVRRTRGTPDVGLWECRFRVNEWLWAADSVPSNVFGLGPVYVVDKWNWRAVPLAAFVAAVRSIDAPTFSARGTGQ